MSAIEDAAADPLGPEQLEPIGEIVLAVRQLMAELDREPTVGEIAERVGMPADMVGRLVEMAQNLD